VRVEPVLRPCSVVVADDVAGLAPEHVLALVVVEHVAAAHVVVELVELADSAAAEAVVIAVDAFGLAQDQLVVVVVVAAAA
jgi:hypothetical protein